MIVESLMLYNLNTKGSWLHTSKNGPNVWGPMLTSSTLCKLHTSFFPLAVDSYV